MSIVLAVLTDRSCGEACWHAKEDVCRCECGGVNHGILLKDGAEQPMRHSRIEGSAYELIAVGDYSTIRSQFYDISHALPPKRTVQYYEDNKGESDENRAFHRYQRNQVHRSLS